MRRTFAGMASKNQAEPSRPATTILGVRRDISRTLVVVAEQPQLWAAIRDRLDPALALAGTPRPDNPTGSRRQRDRGPRRLRERPRMCRPNRPARLPAGPYPSRWA